MKGSGSFPSVLTIVAPLWELTLRSAIVSPTALVLPATLVVLPDFLVEGARAGSSVTVFAALILSSYFPSTSEVLV